MSDFFKKIGGYLTTHKKKTLSVAVLASSFIALQYTKRTKTFTIAINKLEERVQTQIEKEFKAKAELLRKNGAYEEIYTYFSELNKALKQSLKEDVSHLFKTDQIFASLRNKSISPEEKKKLWNDFKQEIIIQAVFSLIYIPISKIVFFVRECVISEQEGITEQDNNSDYLLLEAFLTDLSRFVIVEGGKGLCEYLRKELSSIIEEATVTKKYHKDDLLALVDALKNRVLSLEVGPEKSHSHKKVEKEEKRDGIRRLLGATKKRKTKLSFSEGKPFPEFRVDVLQTYTAAIKHLTVLENLGEFEEYLKEVKERQEKGDNIFISSNNRREFKGEDNDEDFPEIEVKHEKLMLTNGVVAAESKPGQKVENPEIKRMKLFVGCGNRFLDLLETRNFNLLGLYSISYEFEKLKNRTILCLKSKGTEEMVLASFLPCLQKIIQEEFISEESDENNEKFYHQKVKMCLAYLRDKEMSEEEVEISYKIMEEAEMKKQVDNGLKEFGKRIFMGNDYDKVSKGEEGTGAGAGEKGLELLLNGLSKTTMGGAPQTE